MATRKINDKTLEKTLETIAKQFSGFKTFGVSESNSEAISTGHDELDEMLTQGARGFYLGGVIELCGSSSSGKTSLAMRTAGNAQRDGHYCCWFDCEASFEPNLALLNGCDPTKLVMPELVEKTSDEDFVIRDSAKILEMVYKAVVSNSFGLVVLDSVAGLMPQRILAENFDPNSMGMAELARNMAQFLPKITMACSETKTSVIFINQLRDQPGVMYGDRFHTPGGKSLNFFAHQRVSVEKIKSKEGRVLSNDENGNEVVIGHYARINIFKNRKAPPAIDTVIEVPIYYREYFPDDAKKAYDVARKLQVVSIRNNILTWKTEDEIILQCEGESGFLESMRQAKFEPRLAAACVDAANSEKNQKRKPPITVPKPLIELAKTFTSDSNPAITESTATPGRKKKNEPALKL